MVCDIIHLVSFVLMSTTNMCLYPIKFYGYDINTVVDRNASSELLKDALCFSLRGLRFFIY